MFWPFFFQFAGFIILMLTKQRNSWQRIVHFSSKIHVISYPVKSLFATIKCCTKLNVFWRTLNREFEHPAHGRVSDRWHVKPREDGTLSSPQKFDFSTGYDQPSVPVMVLCMFQSYCIFWMWGSCLIIRFEWCVSVQMMAECVWLMGR